MRHALQNDAPADGFADCYLLGNGALGAAVHGRPGTERLDLNPDTLWSGGPGAPGSGATRETWRRCVRPWPRAIAGEPTNSPGRCGRTAGCGRSSPISLVGRICQASFYR
jgi:hypothetical protein